MTTRAEVPDGSVLGPQSRVLFFEEQALQVPSAWMARPYEGVGASGIRRQAFPANPSRIDIMAALMREPDRMDEILEGLPNSEKEAVIDLAVSGLSRELIQTPHENCRIQLGNYIRVLKILRLKGILKGLIAYPFFGIDVFPAQMGRMLAINNRNATNYLWDEMDEQPSLYPRDQIDSDKIKHNLIYVHETNATDPQTLIAAIQGERQPGEPVTLILKALDWLYGYRMNPLWLESDRAINEHFLSSLADQALEPGDHVVLFDEDIRFGEFLLKTQEYEEVHPGFNREPLLHSLEVAAWMPVSSREGRSPDLLEIGNRFVVLRKISWNVTGRTWTAEGIENGDPWIGAAQLFLADGLPREKAQRIYALARTFLSQQSSIQLGNDYEDLSAFGLPEQGIPTETGLRRIGPALHSLWRGSGLEAFIPLAAMLRFATYSSNPMKFMIGSERLRLLGLPMAVFYHTVALIAHLDQIHFEGDFTFEKVGQDGLELALDWEVLFGHALSLMDSLHLGLSFDAPVETNRTSYSIPSSRQAVAWAIGSALTRIYDLDRNFQTRMRQAVQEYPLEWRIELWREVTETLWRPFGIMEPFERVHPLAILTGSYQAAFIAYIKGRSEEPPLSRFTDRFIALPSPEQMDASISAPYNTGWRRLQDDLRFFQSHAALSAA